MNLLYEYVSWWDNLIQHLPKIIMIVLMMDFISKDKILGSISIDSSSSSPSFPLAYSNKKGEW